MILSLRQRLGQNYVFVVVAVVFLALMVSAGLRATPGVLILPLEAAFGWDRASISLAAAIGIFLYGLIGPFGAALMLRFGIRRTVLLRWRSWPHRARPVQPPYPFRVDTVTPGTQCVHQTPAAIQPPALLVHVPEIFTHAGVRVGLLDGLPMSPGKESRARHRQHLTHQLGRELSPLRIDPGVLHRDSLAKNAVAFFSTSRSMRSVASSARKREFSASISLTARRFELLTGVPPRSSRTQLDSVLGEIPSLRAAPANPRLSTSDTAWVL
jgi:hypothetical protein